ncbi:MAG: Uma2 family endonuclease [Bacteroidota bacterium]
METNILTKPALDIPNHLVYEMIEGKPIPYRGYESVLSQEKTLDDIMGSSSLQSALVSIVLQFLYQKLSDNKYFIATNEAGLHIDKRNNLATDIGIFDAKILKSLNDKYFTKPPLIAIEVDTKVDLQQFPDPVNYYHTKTRKLLEFGVEKVIWVTTTTQKVMVATAQSDWITTDWKNDITVIDDVKLNVRQLLKNRGIK